jgi:hypothetical protein
VSGSLVSGSRTKAVTEARTAALVNRPWWYDDLCDAWKAAGANAGKRLSSKKACDLQEQAIEWDDDDDDFNRPIAKAAAVSKI